MADPVYGPSFETNRSAFAYGIRDEMPDGTLFKWYGRHVRDILLLLPKNIR